MTGTDHDAKQWRGCAPNGPARPARPKGPPGRAAAVCAATMALALAPVVALGGAGADPLPGAPGCSILPPDNVWNTPVANLPVDPSSARYIAAIGPGASVHPDFGKGDWDGEPMGIPYTVVPGTQPRVPVHFMYASESDPGPYPIPPGAAIEGGPASTGDRHVIVVDTGNCTDYEMWSSYPKHGGTSWQAGSGAVFPLNSDKLRPASWTSADAAGLPILPGLVRADEVKDGLIDHAVRVTVPCTDNRYIWPARHVAGQAEPNCPPMGLRLRLKASVAISQFPRMDRVILQALKSYGMIVADNGSAWYITGAGSNYWDNDTLHELGEITGNDFQVVDESCLEVSPGSGAADPGHC